MTASLHDIYEELDDKEQEHKTTYVIKFLWRDLFSKFDVIGPYFTMPSTMETKFLYDIAIKACLFLYNLHSKFELYCLMVLALTS